MLKSMQLTNFRKHTSLHIDFTAGLNVIRAKNEGGKTTVIEAFGYLIGGVKACRESLAKIATYGKLEKDVKVEGCLEIQSVVYYIKRSKSGAELTYDDQRVTGQTEVTAFIERLLGVDAVTITRLMMATQGGIRGALEQGAPATMKLIETLANFDVIDNVIELVQNQLVTGPATTQMDRLARATAAHEAAKGALVPPDNETAKVEASAAGAAATLAEQGKAEWAPKLAAAKAAVESAKRASAEHDGLVALRGQAVTARTLHAQQRDGARQILEGCPGEIDVLAAAQALTEAQEFAARAGMRSMFDKLVDSYPDVCWDEPRATLVAATMEANAKLSAVNQDIARIAGESKALKSQMQTGTGACKACGQELPNAAAVKKHNDDLEVKILGLESGTAELLVTRGRLTEEIKALGDVSSGAVAYTAFAASCPTLVRADDTHVPPKLVWIGPEVGPAPDVAALQARLTAVKAAAKAGLEAAARVTVLDSTIAEDQATIDRLDAEILRAPKVDVDGTVAELVVVEAQYNEFANAAVTHRYICDQLNRGIAEADATFTRAKAEVAKLGAAESEEQIALGVLEFNNALLKRVKSVRPMVSDKLWGIVLATVSGYFSQMRGTMSVVTRAENEFLVDGESVPGLSGSTLDILGLAIRLALTRTFLPNAPFLILDEPCAAMDDERAMQTLGFLSATGFPQTLLITHEDASESIAQNLITL